MEMLTKPNYINLTAHLITLYTNDGQRWKYLPDERGPAKIDVEYIEAPNDEWGVPNVIQRPNIDAARKMNDLFASIGVGPDKQALVSNLCLYYVDPEFIRYVAAPDASKNHAVRDADGHLKGVRRLVRMEKANYGR